MKKQLIVFSTFFLLLFSCEEKTVEPNAAQQLIQGKWRIIMMGDGNDLFPYETQYITEYYNDSLMREYDTIVGQYTFFAKYKIDKRLLEEYSFYDLDTLIFRHRYEFLDNNNKLKLVIQNFTAPFNTKIYERIR